MLGILALWHFLTSGEAEATEVTFSTFLAKLDRNEVKSVSIRDQDFHVRCVDGTELMTRGPILVNAALIDRIATHLVDASATGGGGLRFEKSESATLSRRAFFEWVPLILLLMLFFQVRQLAVRVSQLGEKRGDQVSSPKL